MYIDMKMTSPLHTSQVRKLVPARKSVPTRKLVRVWSLNSKVNTYLFTDFYGIDSCQKWPRRSPKGGTVREVRGEEGNAPSGVPDLAASGTVGCGKLGSET